MCEYYKVTLFNPMNMNSKEKMRELVRDYHHFFKEESQDMMIKKFIK